VLRIIAGKYRGIKLDEVANDSTRPTTDKNKEMLFNVLGQFFEGGIALDLFSGSGALGIECLSRGMDKVTFVDSNIDAIQIIKKNLSKLNELSDISAKVVKADAIQFIRASVDQKYDLIVADPPYLLEVYESLLQLISEQEILHVGGILVLEADKTRAITQVPDNLKLIKEKVSGNTKFFIYEREN